MQWKCGIDIRRCDGGRLKVIRLSNAPPSRYGSSQPHSIGKTCNYKFSSSVLILIWNALCVFVFHRYSDVGGCSSCFQLASLVFQNTTSHMHTNERNPIYYQQISSAFTQNCKWSFAWLISLLQQKASKTKKNAAPSINKEQRLHALHLENAQSINQMKSFLVTIIKKQNDWRTADNVLDDEYRRRLARAHADVT